MKRFLTLTTLLSISVSVISQTASLEFSSGNGPSGNGPTTASQTVTFALNANNPSGNTFSANSPALTATFTLSNQAYTVNGITSAYFGGAAVASGTTPQASPLYPPMTNINSTNTSTNYTSLPPGGSGGIDLTNNYSVKLFTDASTLTRQGGIATTSRVRMATLTISFNKPVNNPVLHFVGMGGFYDNGFSTLGFASEFNLLTSGITMSRLDGDTYLSVSGTQINSTAANPNTSSNTANGSVLFTGTNITSLQFDIYLNGNGGITGTDWGYSNGSAGDEFLIGISLPTIDISGTVFNDYDGATNGINNLSGITGVTLNAVLVDENGIVVAVSPVSTINGTYSFNNVPSGEPYTVQITTNTPTIGSAAPAVVLPEGWESTGENIGTGTGTDATVNGITASFTPTTSATDASVMLSNTNINLGIEQTPESYNITKSVTGPPVVGTPLSLLSNPLQGSDPVTQTTQTSWSSKSVVISTLPTNGFQLYYNGSLVTAEQKIDNYDPKLLTIEATSSTPLNIKTTNFKYAVVDDAGIPDPTPATFTINFSSSLPVVFDAIRATINNGILNVNWSTLMEKDCKNYEIEGSIDGAKWISIGKLNSKAINGNSDVKLNYEFSISAGSMAVAGISIALMLLLMPVVRNRRMRFALTIAVLMLWVAACNKKDVSQANGKQINYIRIVQYGTDGTTDYSPVVKVVSQ